MPQCLRRAGCALALTSSMWFLLGCRPDVIDGLGSRSVVRVAAASDLQFAMDELVADFERVFPSIDVQITYGSSGNFYAQLRQRAPFDIYFSADTRYTQSLVDEGLADGGTEWNYAIGQIALWVRNDSPIDIESLGIDAVLESAAQTIAIANPQHAPYGRAAEAALRQAGLWDRVRERIVLGDNVAQTAQFVESGAADLGIIAWSLAVAPALKAQGRGALIPSDLYPAIEQGSVILEWAADRVATEQFRDYVRGAQGSALLERYGFIVPGD